MNFTSGLGKACLGFVTCRERVSSSGLKRKSACQPRSSVGRAAGLVADRISMVQGLRSRNMVAALHSGSLSLRLRVGLCFYDLICAIVGVWGGGVRKQMPLVKIILG